MRGIVIPCRRCTHYWTALLDIPLETPGPVFCHSPCEQKYAENTAATIEIANKVLGDSLVYGLPEDTAGKIAEAILQRFLLRAKE